MSDKYELYARPTTPPANSSKGSDTIVVQIDPMISEQTVRDYFQRAKQLTLEEIY